MSWIESETWWLAEIEEFVCGNERLAKQSPRLPPACLRVSGLRRDIALQRFDVRERTLRFIGRGRARVGEEPGLPDTLPVIDGRIREKLRGKFCRGIHHNARVHHQQRLRSYHGGIAAASGHGRVR